MSSTNLQDPVVRALENANLRLSTSAHAPFSSQAFTVLRANVTSYISDLIAESRQVAHRHRADLISASHVERASEYLVASTSRRLYRHLGTIGGVMLGAGLSTVLSMIGSESFTSSVAIVSISLSIAGAFLVALHMAKE